MGNAEEITMKKMTKLNEVPPHAKLADCDVCMEK